MGRQADSTAWEEECAVLGAPADRACQTFDPSGARVFEEVDRLADRRKRLEPVGSVPTSTFIGCCRRQATPSAFSSRTHRYRPWRDRAGTVGTRFSADKPDHLTRPTNRGLPLACMINIIEPNPSRSCEYQGAHPGTREVCASRKPLTRLDPLLMVLCTDRRERGRSVWNSQVSADGAKNLVYFVDDILS